MGTVAIMATTATMAGEAAMGNKSKMIQYFVYIFALYVQQISL